MGSRLNGWSRQVGEHIPAGSILRISDKKTMQLLDLYHKEECLWNTHHDCYKDQMSRKRAAEKIASLLNIPNFGPKHVLMKFKNLRNAYSQELKKIARNEEAGVLYTPSVFWYKKMDSFIRPHLQKPRRSGAASNSSMVYHIEESEEYQASPYPPYILSTEIEENSENDSCDSATRKRKSQPEPTDPKRVHNVESDSDESKFIEISIPQCPEEETKSNGYSAKIDRCVKEYIDDQQRTVVECLRDLSSSVRAVSARGDVFDSFGRYVAGLLRTLPHEQALEVQPQIINLITAATLENLRNKTGPNCSSVIVKIEEC